MGCRADGTGGLPFPYAAAVVVIATLAGAAVDRILERRLARKPNADLFAVLPQWLGFVAVLIAAVVVNDLETHAPLGDLAGNAAGAAVGGLLLLIPAGIVGLWLATTSALGGSLPPRSRARQGMTLSVWRSAANCLVFPNVLSLFVVMHHSPSPWTSVGSIVAVACVTATAFVLVAQRVLLGPAPARDEAETSGYRKAPNRDRTEEVTEDERKRLAKRELTHGVISLLIAAGVAALHSHVLAG